MLLQIKDNLRHYLIVSKCIPTINLVRYICSNNWIMRDSISVFFMLCICLIMTTCFIYLQQYTRNSQTVSIKCFLWFIIEFQYEAEEWYGTAYFFMASYTRCCHWTEKIQNIGMQRESFSLNYHTLTWNVAFEHRYTKYYSMVR